MRSLSQRAREWIQARGVLMDTLSRPANQEAPSNRRCGNGAGWNRLCWWIVNKFVIHKNGKEFPVRISGVQTNSKEALHGKEGVFGEGSIYPTSCSGYTLELCLATFQLLFVESRASLPADFICCRYQVVYNFIHCKKKNIYIFISICSIQPR